MKDKVKVLVLGATGMLGNVVLRLFTQSNDYEVIGTARSLNVSKILPEDQSCRVICGVNVENYDELVRIFDRIRPNIVINCIGLVKQAKEAEDVLMAIPVNTLLPHRLAILSELVGARLIHISTDCVFSGDRGMYTESDTPDAQDIYGRSKYLGEVSYSNTITLRTSIIGHELSGARGLVGWFLQQNDCVRGYRKAIFSGLPTIELAKAIRDFVIPFPELQGIYHISAEPIDKFTLLNHIANTYQKKIDILPDENLVIDRSLNSNKFRLATGFIPKPWSQLVLEMHRFR
jgi:dTDP-4-dehydrorhamnose reductase